MISDFEILGIEETADLAAIKSAYRRRMKELHPDISKEEDSFERHVLFMEVCQAYKRILAGLGGRAEPSPSAPPRARSRGDAGAPPGGSPGRARDLVSHADPAYVLYKNGMKQFMKIHPSQWNIDSSRMLNTRIGEYDQEQEVIRNRILALVKLFPKAYYYFSLVVHEFPDSPWAFDAQDKMRMIEERTRRYRKIIESFSTWNEDPKAMRRRIDELNERFAEARRQIDAEGRGT